MKSLRSYLRIFQFCILFLITNYTAFCQEKISFATGFGIPEWLYLGVRVPVNQFQVEFTAGASPAPGDKLFSFATNAYYHFAGSSKFSERKPWFAKTGTLYMRDNTGEYTLHTYLYWNLRGGREFNFSKKLGFSIDAGIIYELNKWETVKKIAPLSTFSLNLEFPVLPSVGVHLFYKI